MNVLMVIFTAVIAASTIVYTVMSYRQWQATKFSADLTRLTAFINLMFQYHQWVEEQKKLGTPGISVFEQFEPVMVELGITELFVKHVDLKKNRRAVAYLSQLEGILRANNIDPDSIPPLRPFFRKLKD